MYEYSATVVKVYDGDTITVDIDLGFGIVLRKQKIRLYGVNTPEVRGEEKELGKKVRDLLREKILGETIIVKTIKDKKGKYGRWLGTIFHKEENINDWLLSEGHALPF
jgi:micrococcal nuclease